MEALLKNTIDRFLVNDTIRSELENLKEQKDDGELHLNLVFKYGLDGSGDQESYNQQDADVDTVLASQMCPLQLVDKETNSVIFQNPLANCPCSHRPVRLSYEPETREAVEEEYERMKGEIEEMLPYSPQEGIIVHWVGIPTLCDGKTLTYVTDEAAHSTCPLCGAKEKAISTKGKVFVVKTHVKGCPVNVFLFGMAPTHQWIRSATLILNLGAYCTIKKPKVQNDNDKAKRATRQIEIARRIKEELNLTVFGKGPHGGGVLDGNTSRKLFENAELFSEICRVPLDLILALRKLCRGAASSKPIDPEKFQLAAEDFERIFFEKYLSRDNQTSWYWLPSSIHKVVKHGSDIIAALPVPPGLAGEEGAEGNNKFFRSIRKDLTCKISAERTLKDLFERLLAKSDPVMNEYVVKKVLKKRKDERIPDDLRELLTDEFLQSIEDDEPIDDGNDEAVEEEEEDMDYSENEGDEEDMEVDSDDELV